MGSTEKLFAELEEKRKNISIAAVKTFAVKRFDRATVEEIATSAGVGKGTFYLYFNSKEELLSFLFDHGIKKLIEYVQQEIKKGRTPSEKLKIAISAQLDFNYSYEEYINFFLREFWNYREELKKQVYKLREEYIVIFQDIIEKGIEKGEFKDVDAETISSGLFGMLNISSTHWTIFSDEFPIEDMEESIKKVFLEGIIN